jgi:hypothetical protein
MIDPNASAYPRESMSQDSAEWRGGLSIRAELAARAMQGLLPNFSRDSDQVRKAVAVMAVLMADALIEELNRDAKT